jgi:hypothetical protein
VNYHGWTEGRGCSSRGGRGGRRVERPVLGFGEFDESFARREKQSVSSDRSYIG